MDILKQPGAPTAEPAFPQIIPGNVNQLTGQQSFMVITGMSLRDYFAAQYLAGLAMLEEFGAVNSDKEWLKAIAADCYKAADAMIEARKEAKNG